MELLKELTAIRGVSSDEFTIASFIVNYCKKNAKNWKVEPKIIFEEKFQDCVILVFGTPRTAIYAHTDTIGYSVAYNNKLIKVGGPKIEDGISLVGSDSKGELTAETHLFENMDGNKYLHFVCDRDVDRGTLLSYAPNFKETEVYVQSPYLDNRLGVWNALKVAETLENGAIVFSTYEEHGGNSVDFCAKYLFDTFGVKQALISDITWVTDGVKHGGGVAISARDSCVPRRKYLNKIIAIATEHNIPFQLEVESAGGSDGGVLQKGGNLIDWCFIGAPEDHVHSPKELVYKSDIESMLAMYQLLMKKL